jgi:hypothetical protein
MWRRHHRTRERFVADGHARERGAIELETRDAIRARFAEELLAAPWWRRWWLRLRLERNISAAMRERAPRDGLYLQR